MSSSDTFIPLWPFLSGWAQTIAAIYAPQKTLGKSGKLHTVTLDDGDRLVVCENFPTSWCPGDRVVILVHGLTGSAYSKDAARLGRTLFSLGLRVFRVNLRNCGPGFGMAKKIYHSGRSEDTRAVVKLVSKICPKSPITQIGFSLGGNITLKMAGEDGEQLTGELDSVVAVSPPADLAASAKKLSDPRNRIFDSYFVRRLKSDVARLNGRDPDFYLPKFPKKMSLTDFDDLYTAPCGGFLSATDYYHKSSSLPLIGRISCRTLIIGSHDDPVVDMSPLQDLKMKDHQTLIVTKYGGHCGYLGYGGGGQTLRWMDHVIVEWLRQL